MGFPYKATSKDIVYVEKSMALVNEIDFLENAERLGLNPNDGDNVNEKMYLFSQIFGYKNLRTSDGFTPIAQCPESHRLAAFKNTYNSAKRKVKKVFPYFEQVLQSKS